MKDTIRVFSILVSFTILIAGCAAGDLLNSTPAPQAPTAEVEPTPTTPPADDFLYTLHVQDSNTSEEVISASITIDLPGEIPLREQTGSDGRATAQIPVEFTGEIGRLTVEAIGYEPYRVDIALNSEQPTESARLIPTNQEAEGNDQDTPSLYIRDQEFQENSYLIKGENIEEYAIGDTLIVYGEILPGNEISIALLKVIKRNPDTVTAQATLVHPERRIRPGLRVDDQTQFLAKSELVPAMKDAVGYIRNANSVRIRANSNIQSGSILEALEFEVAGAAILDAFPFAPPILMRVTSIGTEGTLVRVELVGDVEMPITGTIVRIVE